MKTGAFLFIAAIAALSLANITHAQVNLDFVTVGNSGNANDTTGYGGIGYTYCIGRYVVTLNQYTTFLNAVAKTDPYGLYNPSMTTDLNIAGIARSGTSGSYNYSVIGASGSKPVTYVTWLQAARFCNWLHNGQPTGMGEVAGSTEQGAYTLNGDTASGMETKNANAQYWIPSENEWYKAAWYDPNYGGPGVGGYWKYTTRSNSAPGNVMGTGSNMANYNNGVYSVTQSSATSGSQNYLTVVGAFKNSPSAYGTFDQGGNVWQWNDAVISSARGMRGASWSCGNCHLGPSVRQYYCGEQTMNTVGLRVATTAPPSPYSGWANHFFGSTAPASQAGVTATPANDGITNLMKYALGLNPAIAYGGMSVGMPSTQITTSGSNHYLTLIFNGTAPDVTYSVEASSELTSWSTLLTWLPGSPPGTLTVVSDTIPISAGNRRFIRLSVTGP